MNKIILITSVIVLVFGCIIKSIHPFYTDETKIVFSRINGDWKSITQLGDNVEKKGISVWTFNAKSIVTYDEKNVKSKLDCTFFKVGKNIFVDTKAGDPGIKINLFWGAGITLVHTVSKVNLNEKTLTITPMNFKWF